MNVDIILKIAAIGILTAIVNQILKHTGKEEVAMITTLAGLVITLFMVIDMIASLFTAVRTLFNI